MSKYYEEKMSYRGMYSLPSSSAYTSYLEREEERREKEREKQWSSKIGYKDHEKYMKELGGTNQQKEYSKERGFVISAENGDLEECRLLLDCSIDINANNNRGTAIGVAARNNHIEVCELLISSKADINLFDVNGQTPLMLAAEHGNINICKLLLSHGADINAKAKGVSLQYCVEYAHKNKSDVYYLFVVHGLYPNVNKKALILSEISTEVYLPKLPNDIWLIIAAFEGTEAISDKTTILIEDPVHQLGELDDTSNSGSWCTIL